MYCEEQLAVNREALVPILSWHSTLAPRPSTHPMVMHYDNQPTASRRPSTPSLRGQSAKCDRFATVLQPFFETQILSYSAPTAYVVHVIKRLHFTGPTERNRTLP